MKSINVIIPAYNEENRIGEVLKVIKEVDLIDDIIVVSDGSKDDTVKVAKSFDVKVFELPINRGKGTAITEGLKYSESDIILLLDGDLIGITPNHVTNLLLPLIEDIADMTIGVFNNGRFITDLAQRLTPYLSGQRAIKSTILKNIINIDKTRYDIELAITEYVSKNNIRVKNIILDNLTHVMKEEKMGLLAGFKERLKMYLDILRYLSIKKLSFLKR